MTPHQQWLAQVQEEALEPDRVICDAHHHLWRRSNSTYWVDEFLTDISSGHKVTSSVFVECETDYRSTGSKHYAPVGETDSIATIQPLAGVDIAAAIIGYADLNLGDKVKPILEAHIRAAPGRFRGIRHAVAWDSDPRVSNSHSNPFAHMLLDKQFQQGFAQLAPLGLSFEAWLYHHQLGGVVGLARAFPETTIVLNHVGGPVGIGPYAGKRDEVFAHWSKGINELAGCPNVYVKLGGIAMERNGFAWHLQNEPPTSIELAQSQQPYYETCLEAFGAKRCMFESNFPVDGLSCSYGVLWNAFKRVMLGASEEDKIQAFSETANGVYRSDG